MNLADLTQRAWRENRLMSVLVELTYRCNLDCFFCYNDRGLQGEPLSRARYFRLLEDLYDMQVLNVTLSGGEPLAHPDFFAIGARARELGFVVRIKSNGHALNRQRALRIQAEIDPFGVDISLHGATAGTHDRQTRVPGSFDQLMQNLAMMREIGLRFRLNGTVTAWNEHEIDAMFDLAAQLRVPFNMSSAVTPRDNGDLAPLSISPSPEAIGKVFERSLSRMPRSPEASANVLREPADGCAPTASGEKQCGTGSSTLTIDPVGNILPCVQWRRPVGNLHRQSVKDVWLNSAELEDVRRTAIDAKKLVESQGNRGRLAGYCIGEAISQTGSPLQMYPIAQRQLDNRLKVVLRSA